MSEGVSALEVDGTGPARLRAEVNPQAGRHGSNETALYLSADDIALLGIKPVEALEAVISVLREVAQGSAAQGFKTSVDVGKGAYLQALPSLLRDTGIGCVKWVSILQSETGPGIQATVLLTSLRSGRLIAVLDGAWITAVRTAAMSAVAARALARPGSTSIGFIGCGVQAESHLGMLQQVLPGLHTVTAYSRSREGAERFCARARSLGFEATATAAPCDAVFGHDVVVSSVPTSGLSEPFLDASWLADGAFATLVDLGRCWISSSLQAVEVVATDDRAQSSLLALEGKLSHPGPYAFSLGDLACRNRPENLGVGGRRVFIFGGMGACDAAVAALCYRHALARGDVGTPLPRLRSSAKGA